MPQDSAELAVSACSAMVLDYRSLFGQSILEFDSNAAQRNAVSRVTNVVQMTQHAESATQSCKPCPKPSSPMAAKRLPSSGLHFVLRSEPEDFEGARSAPCASHFFGSPTSDDMDSAFSACSMETDDSRSCTEEDEQDVDDALVRAVDSLVLESTSDLLFAGRSSD